MNVYDGGKAPLIVTLDETQVATIGNPGLNTLQEVASGIVFLLFNYSVTDVIGTCHFLKWHSFRIGVVDGDIS